MCKDNATGEQMMANGQMVDIKHPLKNIAKLKPDELPTKKDLRDAVPAHCFEYNLPLSLALVVRDGIIISSIFYMGWNFLPMESSPAFTMAWFVERAAWMSYWFWQGTAFTGWWVLAHECGHRGFSDNTYICDAVGWVLHSFLLVPYFSWQYSHGVHHGNCNSIMNGESHVPRISDLQNGGPDKSSKDIREELESVTLAQKLYHAMGEDAFAVYELITHLVLGWPMYLLLNVTGAHGERGGGKIETIRDHFRPWSTLFPAHGGWNMRIFLSTLGVCLTLFGLYCAGEQVGHAKVAWFYWPSYLWCNFWLVLYTWLQHTAPDLPHFGDDEWTWVRGALCTIDRPYGIFDFFHHRIGSTHVCHHLFSRMPCYNAKEGTAALKAYLEPKGLYNYDDTNFVVAAWKIARDCHYVEDTKGIQHYRSLRDAPKESAKAKKA
jgi:omega-6 fatty acid desaturase (delta-12 desaturase)